MPEFIYINDTNRNLLTISNSNSNLHSTKLGYYLTGLIEGDGYRFRPDHERYKKRD